MNLSIKIPVKNKTIFKNMTSFSPFLNPAGPAISVKLPESIYAHLLNISQENSRELSEELLLRLCHSLHEQEHRFRGEDQ